MSKRKGLEVVRSELQVKLAMDSSSNPRGLMPTNFTFEQEEWDEWDVQGLKVDDFVLVRDLYFRPADDERSSKLKVLLDGAKKDPVAFLMKLMSKEQDGIASGLRWYSAKPPKRGRELNHVKPFGPLCAALQHRLKVSLPIEFAPSEWDDFGIHDLRATDYVKLGDVYLVPSSSRKATVAALREPLLEVMPAGVQWASVSAALSLLAEVPRDLEIIRSARKAPRQLLHKLLMPTHESYDDDDTAKHRRWGAARGKMLTSLLHPWLQPKLRDLHLDTPDILTSLESVSAMPHILESLDWGSLAEGDGDLKEYARLRDDKLESVHQVFLRELLLVRLHLKLTHELGTTDDSGINDDGYFELRSPLVKLVDAINKATAAGGQTPKFDQMALRDAVEDVEPFLRRAANEEATEGDNLPRELAAAMLRNRLAHILPDMTWEQFHQLLEPIQDVTELRRGLGDPERFVLSLLGGPLHLERILSSAESVLAAAGRTARLVQMEAELREMLQPRLAALNWDWGEALHGVRREPEEVWVDWLSGDGWDMDKVVHHLLSNQLALNLARALKLKLDDSEEDRSRCEALMGLIHDEPECDDASLRHGVADVEGFLVQHAKGKGPLARLLAIEALRGRLAPGEWERIESRVAETVEDVSELHEALHAPKAFTQALLARPELEVLQREDALRKVIQRRLDALEWQWEDVLPMVRKDPGLVENWLLLKADAHSVVHSLVLMQCREALAAAFRLHGAFDAEDRLTRVLELLEAEPGCTDSLLLEGTADAQAFLERFARGTGPLARLLAVEALRARLAPGEWERIESRVAAVKDVHELQAAVEKPEAFTLLLLDQPEDQKVVQKEQKLQRKMQDRLYELSWEWKEVLPIVRAYSTDLERWLEPELSADAIVHQFLLVRLFDVLADTLFQGRSDDASLEEAIAIAGNEYDDDTLRDAIGDVDTFLAQCMQGDGRLARLLTIQVLRGRLAPGEWQKIESRVAAVKDVHQLQAAVEKPEAFTLLLLDQPEDRDRDARVKEALQSRLEELDWDWDEVLPLMRNFEKELPVSEWMDEELGADVIVHRLLLVGLRMTMTNVLGAGAPLNELLTIVDRTPECDDDMLRDGLADMDAFLESMTDIVGPEVQELLHFRPL